MVRKRHYGVGAQGHYMRVLGCDVCPAVMDISSNEYAMIRCEPFMPGTAEDSLFALGQMYSLLEREVWRFGAVARSCWKTSLKDFCAKHGFEVQNMLEDVYGETPVYWQRIHGDPTLANVMFTQYMAGVSGPSLRISDPIAPRDKVPSLIEVDMAKMMQSAIGWEALILDWPHLSSSHVMALWSRIPEKYWDRVRFWLMVHLIRILPYTFNTSVNLWCTRKARSILLSHSRGDDPCSTLSILMEL